MTPGKIVLRPGTEGAPWDLEVDDPELAGATFVLQPAAGGGYRMLVVRFAAEEGLAGQPGEFDCKGLIGNHNHAVLR